MAEADRILFPYKEIVEALIKQQNIHEGLWGVYMRFGLQAANAAGPDPSKESSLPVALLAVLEVGIQRVASNEEGKNIPGACDAAVVNPKGTPTAP